MKRQDKQPARTDAELREQRLAIRRLYRIDAELELDADEGANA